MMRNLAIQTSTCLAIVIGSSLLAASPGANAGEWRSWRGPAANGVAPAQQDPPVKWTANHIAWQVDVPGRGHSSPIIVGDRVLLTSADDQRQVQAVFCFARGTGKSLWTTVVNRGGFPAQIHNKNTHASPTLASNGKQVFATFNNRDSVQLVALDLSGKILWNKLAGPYRPEKYQFGYAPSPLLYQDTVIVASEFEAAGFLAAFRQSDGREVWRADRPKFISFSSPIVARVSGREQLLITGADQVTSYDPRTGRKLWAADGTTNATCGTVVWSDDLIFASGGFPDKETLCVRGDGSGQVVWRNREKCYEQSMLYHAGYLYAVNDNGIAFCWDAKTGQEKWKQRLGGSVSASPVLVGERIYATNERGQTFVFAADPAKFTLLAENQLGDESFASLTIVDGQIFARVAHRADGERRERLYCLAHPR